MDLFNPVKYCENLLKEHEIVSLASLSEALQKVKAKVEMEKDAALKAIEKIQQTVHAKGGMDMGYQLFERQARAHKDLESARALVKELNRDYDTTSKTIEEKENQRRNALLLKDLVIELDHYNLNQIDIQIDPKHIIYLKYSLETLDLPEFTTVRFIKAQQAVQKKFIETKNEYFEAFTKNYGKKDVKGMKEAYDVLQDFDGQKNCVEFYVQRVTESLEM
jgi:hypothetical protein